MKLKQWPFAQLTDMDAIVRTWFGGGAADVSYPSYQAWSYAAGLKSLNTVYEEDITRRLEDKREGAA